MITLIKSNIQYPIPNTQYNIIEMLDNEGRDLIVEMKVSAHAQKQDPTLLALSTLPAMRRARLVVYPEQKPPTHIMGVLISLTGAEYADLYGLVRSEKVGSCVIPVFIHFTEMTQNYENYHMF